MGDTDRLLLCCQQRLIQSRCLQLCRSSLARSTLLDVDWRHTRPFISQRWAAAHLSRRRMRRWLSRAITTSPAPFRPTITHLSASSHRRYILHCRSMSSSTTSSSTAVRYLGAIDQGTSSSRFILYTSDGQLVDKHQQPIHPIHTAHQPSWTEQSPIELLTSVRSCIDTVMQRHPHVQLTALGVTNQRETTLVWDRRTGEPVHNAIVWHDGRTSDVVAEWERRAGGKECYRQKTGLPLSTYFSAFKLYWILHVAPHLPAEQRSSLSPHFLSALSASSSPSSSSSSSASSSSSSPLPPPSPVSHAAFKELLFGTVDSWLIWHLTGGTNGGQHVTDVSNASRTLLMNLHTARWDQQLLADFHIPPHMLPTIRPSASVYGRVVGGGRGWDGCVVSGCVGDQQAALLGQLCVRPGDVKNTYGTGCFMLMNVGERPIQSRNGLLSTVAFQLGDKQPIQYALEGSVSVAGAAVQWLRDGLGTIATSADINTSAACVSSSHGLYFVPAFSGLLSPYYRPDARGLLIGLTHSINRHHLSRAVLESAAYQTAVILRAMAADSSLPIQALRVDGGMATSELLCQFQADVAAVSVQRPADVECTAAGAMYAAGLGAGVWKDVNEMVESVRRGRAEGGGQAETVYEVSMGEQERRRLLRGWDRAVERSLGWIEKEHSAEDDAGKQPLPSKL